MTATWNNKKLKTFIKETLGCGCHDEVFEKIDLSKHEVEGCSRELTRIVAGDKLLIYVIPWKEDNLCDLVELVGIAGKRDRDASSYNRFRLVLSVTEGVEKIDHVSLHFSNFFAADEKMHIHFVSNELVEGQ